MEVGERVFCIELVLEGGCGASGALSCDIGTLREQLERLARRIGTSTLESVRRAPGPQYR